MSGEVGVKKTNTQFSKITDIGLPDRFGPGTTIAALDLGSNSFHLVVARAHSDRSFEVLLKEKTMIRLGDVVSRYGFIDEEHLDVVIESIKAFRTLSESLGASEMVALATSAFREAENSSEVVDLIEEQTGVAVSVISGHKEAELIYKAIRTSVAFPTPVVMAADLGGGSLEIMIGSQSELYWAQSFNIGVGRLTAQFLQGSDPISNKELQKMRRHVREVLRPVTPQFEKHAPSALIGSSGSFLNLARMSLLAKKSAVDGMALEDLNQVAVSRSQIKSVGKTILKSTIEDRLSIPGLDSKRVDLIPAAFVVLDEVMQMFGFKNLIVSEWALREGIILSEIEGYDSLEGGAESIRMASVVGVTRRFFWNSSHAEQVAGLALSIFDQTKTLHQLSEKDRELLHYGALLHDIGEHIAMEDHDKHSAYLIENSRLRGFTPEEKKVLVCIGRFHRRGTPKTEFPPFAQLDDDWRETILKLVSILRLADALDRSHEAVVNSIKIQTNKDRVVIYPEIVDEFELESFGLRRKRGLFEQVFGVKVEVAVGN